MMKKNILENKNSFVSRIKNKKVSKKVSKKIPR